VGASPPSYPATGEIKRRAREMPKYFLILLMLALAATEGHAAVYKWVDEAGRTHYSGTPPPGKKAKEVDLAPPPSKQSVKEAQQRLQQYLEQERRQQPQEVLGTITLGFAPTALASSPEPPIHLTLSIKPQAGGLDIKHPIADPSPVWQSHGEVVSTHQNFNLSLAPGDYRIMALEVQASSLADASFVLPVGGPSFTVPEGNCVYIGRIGFFYTRLPPGSAAKALAATQMIAEERGRPAALMVYLHKGALIPTARSIDQPTEVERTPAAEASKQLLARAHEQKCAIQLAK
jgi:hypothetical protein